MALHSAKAFARFIATLPAATVAEQWESHVAKVGGKVFALLRQDGGPISFKVSEIAFEGLTELDGIDQAPYFAKRAWVAVAKGAALGDAELKAYIVVSHRMVAQKLTRKAKAELGLTEF